MGDAPLAARGRRWRWRDRLRRWGWLLVLPVGGAIALPYLSASAPTELTVQQALAVDTLTLEPVASYATERTYAGEVVARRSSELGVELAGTVVELWVEEGERVAMGVPLARLDTRSLLAQRQQLQAQQAQAIAQLAELQAGPRAETIATARAAVAEVQQQLDLARLQQSRRAALYTEGAISREQLDQQTTGVGALQHRLEQAQSQLNELLAGTRTEQIAAQSAQVQQLEARLQALTVDLDKSVLRSPFAGTVSQRLVDEGVVVSPGQPLLRLVEAGALEARVGVPTAVAQRLQVGQAYPVQVGDRTLMAEITALLPEVEATSRTVTTVLRLPPDAGLTLGQTAQLQLAETHAEAGYWLPSTALVPGERGLWSVYVLRAEPSAGSGFNRDLSEPETEPETLGHNTVARRDVEVLHTEGDRLLVRGTLQPGDRAIVSGAHRIVPGQRVQPAP
ncbi:MAG: efflux RND transporter periplasmic adaptor subunit [Kaiparowitsia implicata GSE-PSE-MK54-09C]|nr:efflux RND transporter periplasmic adaptor subunit [Kaiparowitsia implicata GSE-PSE-MK54-09C]